MRSTVHSTGLVGYCCICAFFLEGVSRYGSLQGRFLVGEFGLGWREGCFVCLRCYVLRRLWRCKPHFPESLDIWDFNSDGRGGFAAGLAGTSCKIGSISILGIIEYSCFPLQMFLNALNPRLGTAGGDAAQTISRLFSFCGVCCGRNQRPWGW